MNLLKWVLFFCVEIFLLTGRILTSRNYWLGESLFGRSQRCYLPAGRQVKLHWPKGLLRSVVFIHRNFSESGLLY